MVATANDHGPDPALSGSLKKTQEVQADIESASDHVGVIGTVLSQELPPDAQVGEVAQAIEQTGELEQKLAQSAEQLAEVSAVLAAEIAARRALAEKLEATQDMVEKLSSEADEPRKP